MFSLEYLRRTSLLNGKEKLMGNISSTISNIDKSLRKESKVVQTKKQY